MIININVEEEKKQIIYELEYKRITKLKKFRNIKN